ncbi:M20/M25/M40 family metallo-hydrolase [Faecalicatena sp. Marseille-Q4148]|nr:M20/M25/M40 family metallo-hydrolase [Faecalicatena sp. Marseille-Q4148]
MSRNWEKINRQIDTFIENNQNEIIENVCRLVGIPSVEEEGCTAYPYGAKCAEALDFCAELAKEKGLIVDNYDYYGLEIRLQKEQSGKRLLFAAHADVVPASEGNLYPPFQGIVDKGYIIGRGVVDDKAPLIALLYALAFLKEEELIPMNDIRLFVGSHEETDMEDLKYYLQRAGQPEFGIAADDDFPITNGEKSVLKFQLKGKETVDEVKELLQKDSTGEVFGLSVIDPVCGRSRCKVTEEIDEMTKERILCCDLRLPSSENLDEAEKKIRAFAEKQGLEMTVLRLDQGYWISEEEEIPSLLVELYHKLTTLEDRPYIMEGCTYARHFKQGCGFGAGQQGEKKPFPEGHGSAHGPDEAQNIQVLLRALKLDILAALAIDELWSK